MSLPEFLSFTICAELKQRNRFTHLLLFNTTDFLILPFFNQPKSVSIDTTYHVKRTHISRIALKKNSFRHDHERTKVFPLLAWPRENNETTE